MNSATSADTGAPLSGRSVIVTRARHQSRALAEPLEALGAEVLAFPVIEQVDPEDWGPADLAIDHLGEYTWVVFTSANAVDRFLGRLEARTGGASRQAFGAAQLAAVGSATAERLEERGLAVDVVPDDYRAEGLVEAFSAMGASAGWRVLVPRALEAREILPEALRRLGAVVDVAPVYRTVACEPDAVVLRRLADGVDAITFTSPSTFRHFVRALCTGGVEPDTVLASTAIASIGPVTTDAVAAAGHRVAIEPAESTVPALVEAIAGYLQR